MTYLVLGSNAFSAGSFIDYLLEAVPDAHVIALSRSEEYHPSLLAYRNHPGRGRVHFHRLDLNRDLDAITELIAREKPAYIFNFAAQGMVAQSWDAPQEWFATNTLSLVNLLQRIHRFDFIKKFVQVSTPEVYGSCEDITESMCLAPSSPYAASKASADLALHAYFKTHGFPVNYTRAANVYGAYQQLYRIIPKCVLSIKKGEKLPLHGGGTAVRSFIHIRDVASATLAIAHDAPAGEIYHISDARTITIRDLVALICETLGKPFNESVEITEGRVGEDSRYLLNSDKLRNAFGWSPIVGLREGIAEVADWIERDFKDLCRFPDYYIHKP